MTDIPASAREFERWMADVEHEWPTDLVVAGTRALLTMKSLDQPNAEKSPALLAFAQAYGALAASKG